MQHWYGFNWVLCLLDFRKQDVGKFLLCGHSDHGHLGILFTLQLPKVISMKLHTILSTHFPGTGVKNTQTYQVEIVILI